jgi:hypothetical protein
MADVFHVCPWSEKESLLTGEVILRPMVDVRLELGGRKIGAEALIDTGAPVTVFQRGVGDMLEIDFPELGEPGDTKVILFNREWPAVTRTVALTLPPFDDLGWMAQVRFVIDEGLPFGLLGYEGFLSQWVVTFNAYRGYTIVESLGSFEERPLPVDTWDEFQKDWDGWDRPG